ncbi:glycosyltransferase family 2 protein, partial [Desulfovibrio sp.]|uniref:glycosyltransferase family 2 protein n=1 Tax=Desulfovibrio sp. TaxID=885 RepID=UPI0039E2D328
MVSVLLPAYNAAHTLGAALRSLFAQQSAPDAPLPSFEIVVVNDGSTDGSAALLEALTRDRAARGRLRALHLPHGGIVAALNAGLAAARGTFIARMDADD